MNRFGRYFVVLLAIRVMGPESYGYYVIGLTVMGIGQVFANVGLEHSVFRFIPIFRSQQDVSRIKGVIRFAGISILVTSVLIAILVRGLSETISVGFYDKPDLVPFINFLALTLPLSSVSTLLVNTFKGFNVIRYKILVEDITIIASRIGLLLVSLAFSLGTLGVLYAYLISLALGVALGGWLLYRHFPELASRDVPSTSDRRAILNFSVPLSLGSVMNIVLNRTDILTLTYFLSAVEVGVYSIAQKFAQLVFFVAGSTFAVFTPSMAELYGADDRLRMQETLNESTRWALLITFPIFAAMILFAPELLSVFGEEYVTGRATLWILATAFLLNSIIGFSGQVLTVVGRSKLIFANSVVGGSMNLILNIMLIPQYGLVGAALATGFSVVALNVARTVEIKILEGFTGLSSRLFAPVGIGTVAILAGTYANQTLHAFHPWLRLTASASVFGALYCGPLLVWVLDAQDRMVLRKLLARRGRYRR